MAASRRMAAAPATSARGWRGAARRIGREEREAARMGREYESEALPGGPAALMAGSTGAFAAVWEAAADAMALSDPEGIVLLANPAYCELYGYDPDAVIGRSFAVIFPSAARAAAEEQYRAIFQGPASSAAFESVVQRG